MCFIIFLVITAIYIAGMIENGFGYVSLFFWMAYSAFFLYPIVDDFWDRWRFRKLPEWQKYRPLKFWKKR